MGDPNFALLAHHPASRLPFKQTLGEYGMIGVVATLKVQEGKGAEFEAVFVELSAWPSWVNLTAAMTLVVFFVGAIIIYIVHGAKRDTTNQLENAGTVVHVGMWALIIGEIGGFAVLLAGFLRAWLG